MGASVRILRRLLARPDVRDLLRGISGYDAVTHRHSLRVARVALEMGQADRLPPDLLDQLAVAALFHDLGKTALDIDVISKPGALDAAEREHVRQHPRLGVEGLRTLEAFPDAHRIAPLHHELGDEDAYPRSGGDRRHDPERGTDRRRPLPDGLARAGRILALADRYDALVSHRPYKGPLSHEEAVRRLSEEMPDVAPLLRSVRSYRRPPR
jgi:putative nucleotidyltransferase with HDIG domain